MPYDPKDPKTLLPELGSQRSAWLDAARAEGVRPGVGALPSPRGGDGPQKQLDEGLATPASLVHSVEQFDPDRLPAPWGGRCTFDVYRDAARRSTIFHAGGYLPDGADWDVELALSDRDLHARPLPRAQRN